MNKIQIKLTRDYMQSLLQRCIDEDGGFHGDVTTRSIVSKELKNRFTIRVRGKGTIAGLDAIADSILGTSTRATVEAQLVDQTVDRSTLWELQTPQIFESSLLRRGYEQEDLSGVTDDAQVIEKLGEPVHLIKGDRRNIKVTTPADLQLVKAILGVKVEKQRPVHKRF